LVCSPLQMEPLVLWVQGERRCVLVHHGLGFELQLFLRGRLTVREAFASGYVARQKAQEWAAILQSIPAGD